MCVKLPFNFFRVFSSQMIYMAFLHLMFAILSHLVIYWVWLRPCSRKFQCDLLTLRSSPQLTSSGSPYYTPQYTTASRRISEQPALTKHKDLHTQVLNRKNKQLVQVNSSKPGGLSQLVNAVKSNHTVSMNPISVSPTTRCHRIPFIHFFLFHFLLLTYPLFLVLHHLGSGDTFLLKIMIGKTNHGAFYRVLSAISVFHYTCAPSLNDLSDWLL